MLPRGNKTLLFKDTLMKGKNSERNQVGARMPASHAGKTDRQKEAKDERTAAQRRENKTKKSTDTHVKDLLPPRPLERQPSKYHDGGGGLSDPETPAGTPSSVPRTVGTDPSFMMTLQTARTSATQDMLRCEHAGPSDPSGHVSTKEQPSQRIPFRLKTKQPARRGAQ